MNLAFWRRKSGRADAAPKRSPQGASLAPAAGEDDTSGRADDASAVRVRARRRLIGAAALLLAVAIIVPMLLDPAPRPVSDNIAIDIPSERTPFTPRLSLPPVPAPENSPLAPPADAPVTAEIASKGEIEAKSADKGMASSKASEIKDEEQRARTLLDGKVNGASAAAAAPAVVKGGKFAVQAAAPASESAANELVERLRKAGFAPYTERTETKDGVRFRVRIGPFSTRDDADKVRARLKTLGVSANVVSA
jgi:DedD protein